MSKTYQNPMIPMLAVTGRPDQTKIEETVENLSRMGLTAFMLYGRDGCELQYLEEEWFEVIGGFLQAAKKRGMQIWLYDEFNWPSGQAGGKVTGKKEAFCLHAARVESKDGELQLVLNHSHHPNVLSDEAMDYFVELTFEAYAARFGEEFGKTIVGIFTDEPAYGYAARMLGGVPWYDGVEEDYRVRYHRPLLPDMAQGTPEFRADYNELLSQQFEKAFTGKLGRWCREHGLLLTGHLDSDCSPCGGVSDGGRILRQLGNFGVPGIDEIATDLTGERAMYLFSVAEYVARHSEHGAMAELFALGPIDMTYRRKRQTIFLAALFGIDHYFLAISHLDMRGNAIKKRWFMNHSTANPDWKGYLTLGEEARYAAELANRPRYTPVRIRHSFRALSGELAEWTPRGVGGRPFRGDLAYYELVNNLRDLQIGWALLDDGEGHAEDDVAVFDYQNGGFLEEKSGLFFETAARAAEYAATVVPDCGRAYLPDGEIAKDLVVRHFKDGGAVILDMTEGDGIRRLEWVHKGVTTPFLLSPGKLVDTAHLPPIAKTCPAEMGEMRLELKNRQYFRLNYTGGIRSREFEVTSDLEDVTLLVRTWQRRPKNTDTVNVSGIGVDRPETVETAKISLDGNPVEVCGASELPVGLRELYGESKPFALKKGRHTLSVENDTPDYMYLPVALLRGRFRGNYGSLRLEPLPEWVKPAEALPFFGTAVLTGRVTVPSGAIGLWLETSHYGRVYINGDPVDTGYADRMIPVDPALRGESVTLRYEQESDLAGLFGDDNAFEADAPGSLTGIRMQGTTGMASIQRMEWILEE
ncbi:MAG: hypothetical protein IKU11_11470 [Clostridia bacterium]|nr:hypothetical protein [Clostridia bacterium]